MSWLGLAMGSPEAEGAAVGEAGSAGKGRSASIGERRVELEYTSLL